MPDDPKKPINLWEVVDFPEDSSLDYATGHFVQSSGREIILVLHKINPPSKKSKGIAKIILHPIHAVELIHNLQSQLARLKKSQEKPPEEEPPRRK